MSKETAIKPTREENYPQWYQEVVRAAEMAEVSPVRGCMVIKPWGFGIWENIQSSLDKEIKKMGVENAYFPLFIPLSFIEKEAEHIEGFAKECAVVTHHRLEIRDGKLVPSAKLTEPLVIRPTSETIIGESFKNWIQSYRDLPLKINQWCNIVRWEMRTRLFLRTSEFLWQEGHTAHRFEEEAKEQALEALKMYKKFAEDVLALPVIEGKKSEGEKFPGADTSYTIEGMMQDRKALQCGTSHFLGQNFSKASEILFSDEDGELKHPFTTSWGVSTRLIGALIMAHGDDNGVRVPPAVAPVQVVILPVVPDETARGAVFEYAEKVSLLLKEAFYREEQVRVKIDTSDIRGGEKNWRWVKKGVPIRIEVGPRDIKNSCAVLMRRDKGVREKESVSLSNLSKVVEEVLSEIQENYFKEAKEFLDAHIIRDIKSFEELREIFTPKNESQPEIHGGFALIKWAGSKEDEKKLAELKLSIRCIPFNQSGTEGVCPVTGHKTTQEAIVAKAY
ncbi:MAG: proline--tRNA ligase [Candidatus Dadabacteria bacterium]|nr:MAG: proline--tRNA ligase [Candidatus Dadabacteria bacterium]